MDTSKDIAADLSPLEQRRTRLRAFADRVLEAVESLPMPKTAVDADRTLRAVTAADRMLVQIYSRVTPLQQQPISHTANSTAYASSGRSSGSIRSAPRVSNLPKTPEEPPFVYRYDDDDIDDAPDEEAEPLSPTARAALDLEQQANDIFNEYLKAIAETSDTDTAAFPLSPPEGRGSG